MGSPNTLRLTSHDDIVAAVPYLVGFHPTDSLVCVVLDGTRVRFVTRVDLPPPSEVGDFTFPAAQAATVIARFGTAVVIVGYGAAPRVEPAAAVLAAALGATAVVVREVLRVEPGRFWCLCGAAGCADGVPYDPSGSSIAAAATYLGVNVLPDRAALGRLITPVTGPDRDRMRAATDAALHRLTSMLASDDAHTTGGDQQPGGEVVRNATAAVDAAYAAASRGEQLSDTEVAWLTVVLVLPEVRDHAWSLCDGGDGQRRLWIDVTRRAMPDTNAAPACLLAITAYAGGDGALANMAVDLCLQTDPKYRLAHLIRAALQVAMPPRWLLDNPDE